MLRTTNPQQTLWEAILPEPCRLLPAELAAVDRLLDDPVFLAPLATHFHATLGRPSIPLDTYLRMMFLKFRHRLGYELLCREIANSICWQRFCRIPLGGQVPHPTTLAKLTRRMGEQTVQALNRALLAKAAERKLLRTHKLRADTTVVAANIGYPTDAGPLARAIGKLTRTVERVRVAGGAVRTRTRDRRRAARRPEACQDAALPNRPGQDGGGAAHRRAGRLGRGRHCRRRAGGPQHPPGACSGRHGWPWPAAAAGRRPGDHDPADGPHR